MGSVGVFVCVAIILSVLVLLGRSLVTRVKTGNSRPLGLTNRQLAEYIDSLDLSLIERLLQTAHEWDGGRIVSAMISYRQFLFLLATHPAEPVVPWYGDIDTIWQRHSQSVGYAADCQMIFGRLMPYQAPANYPPHGAEYTQATYGRTFRSSGSTPVHTGEDVFLQYWLLSELLDNPATIDMYPPTASEVYVEQYAGHDGEFGGGGAGDSWDEPEPDTERQEFGGDTTTDSGDYDSGGDCGGDCGGGDCGGD